MSAELTDMAAAPTADRSLILEALDVLFRPEDIVEFRALMDGQKRRVDAGYFDGEHRPFLADAAVHYNGGKFCAATYVTLNPVDRQLLARRKMGNAIADHVPDTTVDRSIIRRRWLLLDFDPERAKGTSATDAQVTAARGVAERSRSELRDAGWPDPVFALSGNGYHLLYPLDLPNTDEVTAAVKRALIALSERFDGNQVKLDRSVFNAARITKLYGTVANKGEHSPEWPWRLSEIIAAPPRGNPVSLEQLQALVLKPPATQSMPSKVTQLHPHSDNRALLERVLGNLGIEYTVDAYNGDDRYKLQHCPFNPEHNRGEVVAFHRSSGALAFHCFHNECANRRWSDMRALVDAEWLQPSSPPAQAAASSADDKPPLFSPIEDLLANIQPVSWLVRGYIAQDSFAVLIGEYSSFKSAIAVGWSACIASSTPWYGRKVRGGPVFYLPGEGQSGIARRFRAWEINQGISISPKSLFISKRLPSLALEDGSGWMEVVAEVRRMHAAHGTVPVLVVIDTVARAMAGKDENATKDMGQFVAACDSIRQNFPGCTVLALHHFGKNKQNGSRGNNSLPAAADTEIHLDRVGDAVHIRPEKEKDWEKPPMLTLEKRVVDLGLVDDEGKPVTSIVLAELAGKDLAEAFKKKAKDDLAQRAKELRTSGMSFEQIGAQLGVSKTEAHRLVSQ